jgi:hypothetical protein
MAIAQTNYFQNAHRLDKKVAGSVTNVQPGQLFQINAAGEFEYADGTKKAYPTLNSRFPGAGLGAQGERLEGRDDVSRAGRIAVLKGNFEIGTDQYDKTKTYVVGQPLVAFSDATKKGVVIPFVEASHKAWNIVGWVTKLPADANDFLRYEG